MISNDEIKEVYEKFRKLKEKYPDLIEKVIEDDLRKVANYLSEPEAEELYTWEEISKGNIYSYSVYIHEKTEVEILNKLIRQGIVKSWKDARNQDKRQHYIKNAYGKALFERYKIIQRYIYEKTCKHYNLTQLCYCDVWEYDWDKFNAKKLRRYLKQNELIWYNTNWQSNLHYRKPFSRL